MKFKSIQKAAFDFHEKLKIYFVSVLAISSALFLINTSSFAEIPFPKSIPFPHSSDPELAKIVGHWGYSHALYKGQVQPKRDPDMFLNYQFDLNGNSILSWHNLRTGLFCLRYGKFSLVDGIIHDKVVNLDPDNSLTCAEDPDMRLNTETATPYSFNGDQLLLHLSIGSDPFVFVWTKESATEPIF